MRVRHWRTKPQSYGASDQAIQLYRSLAEDARPGIPAEVARIKRPRLRSRWVAIGKPQPCILKYAICIRELKQQKTSFQAGVRALQSGNLPAEALTRPKANSAIWQTSPTCCCSWCGWPRRPTGTTVPNFMCASCCVMPNWADASTCLHGYSAARHHRPTI